MPRADLVRLPMKSIVNSVIWSYLFQESVKIQQDQNRLIALIEGKSRDLRQMNEELDSRRRSQAGAGA